MAEEEQKSPATSSSKRSRRRRNSRKNRQKKQSATNEATSNAQPKPSSQQEQPKKKRRRRRRPRSRKQTSDQRQQTNAAKDTLDASLPENVFVYTHVVHSSALDTYGFRPDPFMNSTRGMGDFRIDLSSLFPDQGENSDANVPIFDSALHSPINARLTDDDSTDAKSTNAPRDQSSADESKEDGDWLEDVQKAVDDHVDDQVDE